MRQIWDKEHKSKKYFLTYLLKNAKNDTVFSEFIDTELIVYSYFSKPSSCVVHRAPCVNSFHF